MVHRTVPLVGPAGVREQPRHARIHLGPSDSCGELVGTRREILGDEIENLRAHVAAAPSPSFGRVCRLDGIAHVLAIALGDFAQYTAIGPEDLATVPLVGARLFAADEQLVSAVDGRERGIPFAPGRGPGARYPWRALIARCFGFPFGFQIL